MAAAFNLTAQINLRGPANIKPIVSKIQKDINNAKIKLNLDVNQNAAKGITSITTRLNNLSKAATNANNSIGTLNQSLGALVSSLNGINSASTTNINNLAKTTKAVSSAGKAISQTRTQIEEFGKQSGLAIKRFAAFSTVTSVVYGLINAFNSAFKEFFNFNQEVVRLSQVTGKSVSDLGDITKEITRLSTNLGVASSDLLTVATTLAQAGLSAEDTKVALEALAKSALAPSFESLTDTTEGAIAALRQFGLQSKELDSVLGSINAVAAAFAVEAGDIITAIQRTGGVFSSASRGVSEGTDALNEFIAIFTSVRATTRESAETIATGLRTIFTRIQRTKTIEQLREFGIELQDTEGKFVGLFEATRRLSEGLSKIDPRTAEFATISEELGGFRQIGKVIPLIQQFAVTEQALAVAQKGSTSTAKDALIAQQSLAVQFTRTRENFLALVREIGDSTSFKAFVTVSLTLADSFINLARALKPILPLLLTFASIKVGGALTEYLSGFSKGAFGGGFMGGGGGTPTGGTGGGGPKTGGGTGAAALSANTASLNTVGQTLSLLNQSILALNQNIVNTNSLLLNRPTKGFASGGLVPGSGNSDTFRANLTPGEFVIRKKAVESIGVENLARMNSGGEVQRFAGAGRVMPKGRGKFGPRGARSRFKELSQEEIFRLSTPELMDYGNKLAEDIFTTRGAGIATSSEFIEVSPERIVPELESSLISYMGKRGFWREKVSPFGRPKTQSIKQSPLVDRKTALETQISKQADEVAARNQQWTSIRQGSEIDTYLLSALTDPILTDYKTVRGGDVLSKPFHNTRLRQAVNKALDTYDNFDYSPANIDKLVSGMAAKRFADGGIIRRYAKAKDQMRGGGLVQEFAVGGKAQISDTLKQKIIKAGGYEQFIGQNMFDPNNLGLNSQIANFGMIGLRSGTKSSANRTENRKLENGKRVRIHVGFLQSQNDPNFKSNIEDDINKSLQKTILKTAGKFGQDIDASIDPKTKNQILDGAVLSSAVGSVFESALQMIGAPYIDKIEAIKSIDFPFGLGTSSKLFGSFPDNIPTDATRTIAGSGKGISDFLGQINRFFTAVEGGKFTAPGGLEALPTPQKLSARQMAESLFGSVKADPNTQSAINSILKGDRIPGVTIKQTKKRIDGLADQLARNPETIKKLQAAGYGVTRRATGGGISGEDTVQALLTPGEFVFNKKAAQRIGYGTLNRLNKADKIQGFNKGGVVGYAQGGAVDMIGGVPGVIAAITAVILPQIEKLASSFGKLDGTLGTFGAALGGAIREASSLTLSAGIALNTVGASQRTVAIGQAGAAIGGLVGGALTDSTGKALEKALLKNVDVFGKFDKTVQNLSNAPTEELRLQAAQELSKTFALLDASVQNTKNEIDNLENLNNFGNVIKDITLSILTTTAAVIAFQNVTSKAASAVKAAAPLAAGVAGPVGPAVGVGTKLLGSLSKIITPIGIIFGLLEVGIQLFGLFNNGIKKSSEQFDRLFKNLDEATKNSQAFSIANETFVTKVLPQFAQLRKQGLTGEPLTRELGRTPTLDSLNELNFTFRTLLKSRLASEAIPFPDTATTQDIVDLQRNNKQFRSAFEDTTKQFIQRQFVRSQTETGDMSVAEAEKRFFALGGAQSELVKRTVENYVGAKHIEIAALRELTLANNKFKTSLVTLDNILITLASRIETSTSKIIDQFDDLDSSLSILGAEPRIQGGEVLRRQNNVLNNIVGASAEDLKGVADTISGLLNIQAATPEQQKLFAELRAQAEASRILQQELPVILEEIQKSPEGRGGEALQDQLRIKLTPFLQVLTPDTTILDKIFTDLGASLTNLLNSNKESSNGLTEIVRNNAALSGLLKTSEQGIKAFSTVIESVAKVEDKLAEQIKFRLGLENQLIQSTTQRLQLEAQEANELSRLLGVTVSLADLNKNIDIGIQQLTRNIGGGIPQAGTTDPRLIASEITKRRQVAQSLSESIRQNQSDLVQKEKLKLLYAKEVSIIGRLNQALTAVATSGEKTKNALDKIAEAQNKFRSRRQFLIDLLKGSTNPETAIQQQAVKQSIESAVSGSFIDDQQAFLFLEEGTKYLEAVEMSENRINALIKNAVRAIIRNARPTDAAGMASLLKTEAFLLTEGRAVGDIIGSYLPRAFAPFLSKIFPNAPELALSAGQQERTTAGLALEDSLLQQIETSQKETLRIFDEFNNSLKTIFGTTTTSLEDIQAKTRASLQNLPQQQNVPLSQLTTFVEPFNKLLSSLTREVLVPSTSGAPAVYYKIFENILPKQQRDALQIDFAAAETPKAQIDVLNRALDQLVTKGADGAEFMTLEQQEAAQRVEQLQRQIRDAERARQNSKSPSRSEFLNRPIAPSVNEGASLQRFGESVNAFNTSSNLLIKPMEDLSSNMAIFKTTAEKLSDTLNRFSAEFSKEIKASISHSYTGDVNLNLNDTLDVNLQNNPNRDTQLVQNIYDKVVPVIKDTIQKVLLG